MAIAAVSPTGTFTGTKTATSGTTFTITPITTAAKNVIYIAIFMKTVATTVSSISDGGTNTYHLIQGTTNGTARTELWKSDAVAPASGLAAATITVTLSASGSLAVGAAFTYSGVAFGDGVRSFATGSSASPTTGSFALKETGDFLIAAFGSSSATAFSAPTGTIDVQASGASDTVGIIHNTGSASVTCAATAGNAVWSVVWVDIRVLGITADQLTMGANPSTSDAVLEQLNVNITEILADVIELLDADGTGVLTGIEDLNTGGFAHWVDTFRYFETGLAVLINEYNIPLADGFQRAVVTAVDPQNKIVTATTEVWNQGSPVTASQLQLAIICPHLGTNWLDALAEILGIAEILSDSETSNWSDALGVGYGDATSDQLVMSDFAGAGYGSGTSDQLVITDSISSGYGGLLSDSESANWQDVAREVLGFNEILSDSETSNWSDSLAAGYGNAETDTLSMSDFTAAGYGSATSDQLIISESVGAGYGGLLSDQIVFTDGTPVVQNWWLLSIICPHLGLNWLDAFTESTGAAGLTLTLSDDEGANWADVLGLGYGDIIPDTLTMSDFTGAGYGSGTSDQLIISDSLGAGYGGLFSDNLSNWLDAFAEVVSIAEILSDSETANWVDALGVGYGDIITEQITFSDFMAAGYGAGTSDQLIITESIGAGYGALLSDNEGPNWADAFTDFLAGTIISEVLSDNLNNWADYMAAGYGSLTSDQLVITDSIGAGYGGVLSDSLNNWLDSLQELLSIAEILSDSETANWNDSLRVGYGDSIPDQLILTDFAAAGYGSTTSDQLVITDSIGAGYAGLLSDTIIFSDVMGLGYGDLITDTVTFSDTLRAGYGAGTSDQLVILDGMGAGYGGLLSDNLNNWQDAFSEILIFPGLIPLALSDDDENNWKDALGAGYGNAIINTLSMTDFTGAGYGSGTSDNFTIVDSLSAGYGSVLKDTLNNWLDSFQESVVFAVILSDDNENNWSDVLAIGYGDQIIEQLPFLDSLGSGYGSGVVDDLVMVDLLTVVWEIDLQLSDDDETNWADAFTEQTTFILPVIVSDDGEFNWNDALQSFLPLNTAPAFVYAVKSALKVIIDPFIGVPNPAVYEIKSRSRILFSYIPTVAAALLGIDQGESLNFWQDFGFPQMDRVSLGFNDLLTLSDQLDGYFPEGFPFTESLNNWIDDNSFVNDITFRTLVVVDSLNFWQDSIGHSFELHSILADSTLNNWVDLATEAQSGIFASLADTLNNWQDASVLATPDYAQRLSDDNGFNWADNLASIGITLAISDDNEFNWADTTPIFTVDGRLLIAETTNNWIDRLDGFFATSITLTDSAAGFWQDGFSDTVLGTLIQLATGDNAAFLSEALRLGYGDIISDQLTFSDVLTIQYYVTIADQLTFTDILQVGYGDGLREQLTFSENTALGYGDVISSTLSFSDFPTLGYGLATADQIVLSDVASIGQPTLVSFSDQLALVDSTATGYGNSLADQLVLTDFTPTPTVDWTLDLEEIMNYWADSLDSIVVSFEIPFTESTNNWQDSFQNVSGAFSILVNDNISWSDDFFAQGTILVLVLSDDDETNWNDLASHSQITGFLNAAFGENMNSWNEALGDGSGESIVDTLTISDALRLQFGNALTDTVTFSDATKVVSGFVFLFADQITLSDSVKTVYGYTEKFSETLNNWQDFIPSFITVYNIKIAESLTLTDSATWSFNSAPLTVSVSDHLTFTDGSPVEKNSYLVNIICPHLTGLMAEAVGKTLN